MNVLQPIGRVVLESLATAGRLTLFAMAGVYHCFRPPYYARMIAHLLAPRTSQTH